MTRALNDLSGRCKVRVFEFLARCLEAGIPVQIINVLRTTEEQIENIKNGVSWTLLSKHLPQPPENRSEAIDVCPFSQFDLHGPDKLQWDGTDPAWLKIGEIGENAGLLWGGRWKVKDLGHFEMSKF